MDIVSRLKQFLQQNGIANSLFADTCDIPRPTLSQLLNGRNKKVSDEVIAKIHRAYPSLNILWLMFGDGDMYVPNANTPEPQDARMPLSEMRADASTMPQQSISFGTGDFGGTPQRPAGKRKSGCRRRTTRGEHHGVLQRWPIRDFHPTINNLSI